MQGPLEEPGCASGTIQGHAGAEDGSMEPSCSDRQCYLIVYNVSKKHNIGTLARCATAFNVTQICLVGSRQFNTFGSLGADIHVDLAHFPSLEACVEELRGSRGCDIVGVEIMESAQPVHSFPFRGNTAFMLGNEGQGLNAKQLQHCDRFIYIPQYGGGTASLNVAVAASIVLHHYALWAGYPERQRQGQKFVLADRPERTRPRGRVPPTPEEAAAMRAARQAGADAADEGEAADPPELFD